MSQQIFYFHIIKKQVCANELHLSVALWVVSSLMDHLQPGSHCRHNVIHRQSS